MIAGRMRADPVPPVFRSSNLSDQQTRTARENGADSGRRLLPGDWDGASIVSCRVQAWAKWTVARFRGGPRKAESGPLETDDGPGSFATLRRKCSARGRRGFHKRVDSTAQKKLASRLPAPQVAAGCSFCSAVSGDGFTALSLRQSPELRALGRHLRRRAMNEKGNV